MIKSGTLQHLVLLRHGESEGDVRRSAWKHDDVFLPRAVLTEEEITCLGIEQSRKAGLWIQKHVIQAHDLLTFDGCYVSSALRSAQTAAALSLSSTGWQEDNNLNQRNRGKIRGWHSIQHQKTYPESFKQMKNDPLNWVPPGGESLLAGVVPRIQQFIENIEDARTVLAVTHRDWMWAAQLVLENLSEADFLAINSDDIHNAQVIEYTSINPTTGEQAPVLLWKRSVDPAVTSGPGAWRILPHIAELHNLTTPTI
jgi:broad specificity phosphatase PhoE